jgi:aryl-alcohol dehydrogenase-like predicted oxidoreductase
MPLLGTSDLDLHPLALGTNTFGWTSDEATSHAVLDAFVAAGGNLVDTADSYSSWAPGNAGGESETIIGAWLARHHRTDLVLATKVSQHPDFPGLSAANVAAAAEASLKRLGVDEIDLYYAHFDDERTPLAETVQAFSDLVTEGKVRHVGVSNYTADRIAEWVRIADENGFTRPVALQPHYNLVHRQPYERELAPLAEQFSLGVVPYAALASGFLTGKYRTQQDLEGAARAQMAGGFLNEAGLAVVRTLDEVAQAHDVVPATVALAWLQSRPGVVAPIASARTPEQLPDLLAAATLELAADELAALDGVSARVPE